MRDSPTPCRSYLLRSKVLAAPSWPGPPWPPRRPRRSRPCPRDEPRWLQLKEGAPDREEGVLLPGPGRLLRGPGLVPREPAAIRLLCGSSGNGVDSPFLARAESPGRTRAGAWRLLHSYRLTWALRLGLTRLRGWNGRKGGGRWVDIVSKVAPTASLCPLLHAAPLQPQHLALHPCPFLSLYPGPPNSGSAQFPSFTVQSLLLSSKKSSESGPVLTNMSGLLEM